MATGERRGISFRFRREDDGLAMFGVLAVGAIAATLAVVSVTAASGTARRSHRDQRREQAIALAEAGIARALSELSANPAYATAAVVPPTPVTREWVLTNALTAPLADGPDGQYAWIVPPGADVAFGIGYIPSRALGYETRIVRIGIDDQRPFGELSLLTAGNALLNGNVDVRVGGSVHSNGSLTMTGSGHVAGDATSTGSFSKTGSVDVEGFTGGGNPPYDVPRVDPRAHRHRTTFDLCPDGVIRATAPLPCTGTVVGSGLVAGFNGWTWSGSDWQIAGSSATDGGYYVYQANVKITGSVDLLNGTIVVEGLEVGGTLLNGDFEMTGGSVLEARSQGVAVVASRDVVLGGTGGGKIHGMVLTGEQISMSGNVEVIGQMISASEITSTGSPVSTTTLSGNVRVSAEVHAPNQAGGFSTSEWSEL